MTHPHEHSSKLLNKELHILNNLFPSVENYVKMSATPLATIATANSALTITSLLLMLNSGQHDVRLLAAVNLILLLITTSTSIFLLVGTLRANFRISRVLFRVKSRGYMDRTDYSDEECEDVIFLTHLANKGFAAIDRIEVFYQNVLWKFFFSSTIVSFLLLSSAVFFEFLNIMYA